MDPIYKVNGGDENNAEAIGKFCALFDKIAEETGASMIYVHHHAKGSQGAKKAMDRGSGSGVFARDADAIIDFATLVLDPNQKELLHVMNGEELPTPLQMEIVLRSFRSPEPVNMFFEFPLHILDTTHILDGAAVEGSAEANRMLAPNNQRSDADKKEIIRLETTYQMGEEEKVDYNPIEKYLKCQDLRDAGFTTQEISRFMGDSESNVKMYLAVLQLMNEYLENYGYTGMYTVLPSTNEDSFQKLYGAVKGYRAGNVSCMWDFDPEVDTTDLKLIAFDYIRAGFDQTKFRDIIRKPTSTTPAASFFGCKDIWESFKERHFSQIDPVTDAEESVESILQNANPEDDVEFSLLSVVDVQRVNASVEYVLIFPPILLVEELLLS